MISSELVPLLTATACGTPQKAANLLLEFSSVAAQRELAAGEHLLDPLRDPGAVLRQKLNPGCRNLLERLGHCHVLSAKCSTRELACLRLRGARLGASRGKPLRRVEARSMSPPRRARYKSRRQ